MDLSLGLTEARRTFKRLAAAPSFTVFSVVSLAIGLGSTAALHAVIYAILLRPLDVPNIGRLTNIYHSDPRESSITGYLPFSWPDYQDLQQQQSGLSDLIAWAPFRQSVVAGGSATVSMGEVVSGGYFNALGVSPAAGRLIDQSDDVVGATPIVVLSDGFARAHFASVVAAVGQSVLINKKPFQVVGVLVSSFRGVSAPNILPTALWVPIQSLQSLGPAALSASLDPKDRDRRWLWVKGLLNPASNAQAAADQVRAIGQRLDRVFPIGRDLSTRFAVRQLTSRNWTVVPTANVHSHESVSNVAVQTGWLLLSAVTAVLLIGCSNLANLATARGAGRRQELAVRMALGASPRRIMAELSLEGGLLLLAGCLVAPFVFVGLQRYVLSAALQFGAGFTIQIDPTMTRATYLIVFAALALATLVAAVLPAVTLTRSALARGLVGDGTYGTVGRWSSRRNLISIQVAVSTLLVCLASMSIWQVSAASARVGGGWMNDLALLQVDTDLSGYDETRTRQLIDAAVATFPSNTSSSAAIVTSGLPSGVSTRRAQVAPGDISQSAAKARRSFVLIACTSGLLQILPTRLVAGRALDDNSDKNGASPVAVISEAAAAALFGTVPAVGRQISILPPPTPNRPNPESTLTEVVGVISDLGANSGSTSDAGVIYVPFSQQVSGSIMFVARTSDDPTAVASTMRKAVLTIAPDIAVIKSGSGRVLGDAATIPLRASASIASVLGAVCVILSMTGLYGILSYLVSGRTREIGVRLSLGETPFGMMRWILFQGLRPILEGLLLGLTVTLILVFALRPWLRTVLPAAGIPVISAGPIVILLAGLAACYLPALRAARMDPVVALREH